MAFCHMLVVAHRVKNNGWKLKCVKNVIQTYLAGGCYAEQRCAQRAGCDHSSPSDIMAEQLHRTVVYLTNEQWLNEAPPQRSHPSPGIIPGLKFPLQHLLSHTLTHTRILLLLKVFPPVLMSLWPMRPLPAEYVAASLLFIFPPCQHNPFIHPSWGLRPAGAELHLAASSGCCRRLLWFSARHTHTHLSLGPGENRWFITWVLWMYTLVLRLGTLTFTVSKVDSTEPMSKWNQ